MVNDYTIDLRITVACPLIINKEKIHFVIEGEIGIFCSKLEHELDAFVFIQNQEIKERK